MGRIVITMAIAVLLSCTTTNVYCAEEFNYIKNGGFEEELHGKPVGWAKWEEDKMQLDDSNPREGELCVEITKDTYSPEDWRLRLTQMLDDLKEDTTYMLTFWVKTEDIETKKGRWGGVCVLVHDGSKVGPRYSFPKPGIIGTTRWQKLVFEFKTPKEFINDIFAVEPGIFYATGKVWFDDISLTESKE